MTRRGAVQVLALAPWVGLVAAPLVPPSLGAPTLGAQTVRIEGTTSLRYVQVRPVREDSVPVGESLGDGLLRRTTDGRLVRCVSGEAFCRYYRAADPMSTIPGIQDLRLSAWGIGRGLRVYAQLRARTALGEADGLWPRADDAFDALAAYVELERGRFRLRAGRDWKTSGLGFYNYDGASVLVRPTGGVDLEGYAGWSLVRGAAVSPTDDALAAIEPLAPDGRAVLLGAQGRYRSRSGLALAALYQREIRSDRSGLYSERAALDAAYSVGPVALDGSLEADLVGRQVSDARLDLRYTPGPAWSVGAFARRYRPFFELWTIWGAFSPVGFREVGAEVFWRRPGPRLQARASASRRVYEDTGAALVFAPLRSDGWRFAASASLEIAPRWTAGGGVRYEVGSGAGISETHLRARRALAETSWVGLALTAFQRAYEFRVQEGTVYGLGLDAGHRLHPRTRVTGSLAVYRHDDSSQEASVDWSQVRGSLRLDWTVGPEPGLAGRVDGGS